MIKTNLILGDCLEKLKDLEDNSVDSIVTDSPYGISFMGSKWDYDVPSVSIWKECFRVLKPGGHILSFSSARTYHRMAINIEDAGFEIRDQIMWVYGSGFPKSLNVGKAIDKKLGNEREVIGISDEGAGNKQDFLPSDRTKTEAGLFGGDKKTFNITKGKSEYEGWGTALKPAHEPIVLARKPLEKKTVVDNVLEYGTGAINIDACRVGTEEITNKVTENGFGSNFMDDNWKPSGKSYETTHIGRWPANFIHDGSEEWSKYFYCPKANKKDRNEGANIWQEQDLKLELMDINLLIKDISEDYLMEKCEWNTIMSMNNIMDKSQKDLIFIISMASKLITELKTYNVSQNLNIKECIQDVINQMKDYGLNLVENVELIKKLKHITTKEKMVLVLGVSLVVLRMLYKVKEIEKGNIHNTVKPTELMRYLVKLVTPKNGTVLDPFMGSGSTGKAAVLEGFSFIGIELSEEYLNIAEKRINYAITKNE